MFCPIPKYCLQFLFFVALSMSCFAVFSQPREIFLWHSLAGKPSDELSHIAQGFNNSQAQFIIKPVYKGSYLECLASLAAAFRANQAPALVQVFEVGTQSMLRPKGIIKPAQTILERYSNIQIVKDIFPSVKDYYSEHGKLMALPLNVSIPVIFYNKDALQDIGYRDEDFPKTWAGLERLAGKLRQKGYSCVYTTSYPAWIHIESFAALHGLSLIDEMETKFLYNSKPFLKHLKQMRNWQKEGLFQYGGRENNASVLFTSGHCPLYSQSSGGFSSLKELASFKVGMALMPIDTNVSKKRFRNVSGGGALWALSRQDDDTYRGIAQFYEYLTKPEIQDQWQKNTGYLPLGGSGRYKNLVNESRSRSIKLAHTDLDASKDYVLANRLRVQNLIRVINDEALEGIFSGMRSPKEALDLAIQRAEHALIRFQRNTQ